MYSFGGWVPVIGEDGSIPDNETEWKCTNSLVCLNLGECDWELFPLTMARDTCKVLSFFRHVHLGEDARLLW